MSVAKQSSNVTKGNRFSSTVSFVVRSSSSTSTDQDAATPVTKRVNARRKWYRCFRTRTRLLLRPNWTELDGELGTSSRATVVVFPESFRFSLFFFEFFGITWNQGSDRFVGQEQVIP